MNPPDDDNSSSRGNVFFQQQWLSGIALAVFGWGCYLALGAYFNSGERSNLPLIKGLVILLCFALFLGFWGLLLRFRHARRS